MSITLRGPNAMDQFRAIVNIKRREQLVEDLTQARSRSLPSNAAMFTKRINDAVAESAEMARIAFGVKQ